MAKRLYYKIGEACKRLDIQPYVLRYWETEFPLLSPDKSTSGQRVYSEQDLKVIQRIKELLYEEGYTIAGAKKKLEKQDLSSLADLREVGAGAPAAETAEAGGAVATTSEPESKPEPKVAPKTKPKSKPKKKSAAAASGGASEAKLRRGIREALKEARSLLELLDS